MKNNFEVSLSFRLASNESLSKGVRCACLQMSHTRGVSSADDEKNVNECFLHVHVDAFLNVCLYRYERQRMTEVL